jgi:group II intron reverse transcriptase/maturase
MKRSNKVAGAPVAAETVEERTSTKGNSVEQNAGRTQGRGTGTSALDRVRQVAKKDRKAQFTALLHHVYNIDRLRESYRALSRRSSAGVDGVEWSAYGQNLEGNLEDLSARIARGAYRAKPVLRRHVPKGDGGQRPIGIPALEDKIVQRATTEVLNAIYEEDFIGSSYGFRPGRGTHNALDAVAVGIEQRKVNWVLDADIRGFFDSIDHEKLVKYLEHRIGDQRVVRLIQKWLKAGVLEDGKVRVEQQGTPQGGSISPLLANIYLHYTLDLWVRHWRRRHANGDVIFVRYADDFVLGFQNRVEAEWFLRDLVARLQGVGLELHPDKTRLLEFGRFAASNRAERGEGKPETFDFLGFTHICGQSRAGKFQLHRKTIRKRQTAKLKALAKELQRRRHWLVPEVGQWLSRVLQGHYNYFGVPGNSRALTQFRWILARLWRQALRKRSQRTTMTWKRFQTIAARWLPQPRITHPWPSQRLRV